MKLSFLLIFISSMFSCSYNLRDEVAGETSDFGDPLTPIYHSASEEDVKVLLKPSEIFSATNVFDNHKIIRVSSKHSKVSLNQDGTMNYEPHKHFFGNDTINVYWQSNADSSITQSKIINDVEQREDAPLAFIDLVSNLDGVRTVDVLFNDIDVDGNSIELFSVDGIDGVDAEVVDGKVVLTPNSDFESTSQAEIEYRIRDNTGLESTGIIKINGEIEEENSLPIRLVFIGSSSDSKVGECERRADTIIDKLNENFKNSYSRLMKLKLGSCIDDIVDDILYNHCNPIEAGCDHFNKILSDYGNSGVVSLVFVNEIEGGVAGISKLNKLPASSEAAVVSEIGSVERGGVVYTHELGHLFGLDHTQQFGSTENDMILFGSCGQSLRYFQRGYEQVVGTTAKFSDENGNLWDDHSNMMKSEISPFEADLTFFSEGYNDYFSKIFSCYRVRSI